MIKYNSFSTCAAGSIRGRAYSIFSLIKIVLAVAGTVTAMELSVAPAKAAAALWISAPTWSYSAAAADSPIGWAYYWGLSIGAGSYSWAGAYSNDGLGDAGYAFAEAAAGQGGMGAVLVSGLADPYALDAIDITPINPDSSGAYPTSEGSDPFSTPYTVSDTGITFTGSGEELNGDDELQAFLYSGPSDNTDLESEFGLSGDDGGQTSNGDVDSLFALESDLSLIPLDAPIDDPGSLNSLIFTENDGSVNPNNVVLVGITDTPEPSAGWLLGIGMANLLIFRKRRAAVVA